MEKETSAGDTKLVSFGSLFLDKSFSEKSKEDVRYELPAFGQEDDLDIFLTLRISRLPDERSMSFEIFYLFEDRGKKDIIKLESYYESICFEEFDEAGVELLSHYLTGCSQGIQFGFLQIQDANYFFPAVYLKKVSIC